MDVLGVFVQNGQAQGEFPFGWQFHKPNDPAMRLLLENRQRAEVLVARDNDPLLFVGDFQDLIVPGNPDSSRQRIPLRARKAEDLWPAANPRTRPRAAS